MTVLRADDGTTIVLDVDRWRGELHDDELAQLLDLPGPVLDVGCGPGRVGLALTARGLATLGIDTSPAAVAECQRRGAPVLERSVFGPLPGEGRWGSALLLDGNIGIGGDPSALLRRLGDVVRPGGVILADLHDPGTRSAVLRVRVEREGRRGPWFPWATVSVDSWPDLVDGAGLLDDGIDHCAGRWYGRAVRP